jgi:hypothetical protein
VAAAGVSLSRSTRSLTTDSSTGSDVRFSI